MRFPGPARSVALLAFAGCASAHDVILAPVTNEVLVSSVSSREIMSGEHLPRLRISTSGTNLLVHVSRPDVCATVVNARGAREGALISVVATVFPSPFASCAVNIPVRWVADYVVTVPNVARGTWTVRLFEHSGGDEQAPVLLGQQRVQVD